AAALAARRAPGAGGGAPIVLDVRRAEEFAAGRVPGARNLPHDRIVADPAVLGVPKDAEIVVYCQSGRRANMALEALQKAGYTRVSHLEGDYPGWQSQGRPVEKSGP
ncbi:MAG: rhodanese-like domain-containing protein, partial [Gammaproteobacteria bacterium]